MRYYTKLFHAILASSVWTYDDQVRLVWITMLAMVDDEGCVYGTVPGLAHQARVSVPACEKALKLFSGPDKYSASPEHGGRRIESVAGGWRLINYKKYMEESRREHRREYLRKKQQEYRARKRAGGSMAERVYEKQYANGESE